MYNTERFQQLLTTSWVGQNFEFLSEIDSTNNYAKTLKNLVPGTVVLTEHQTSGKGQKNKTWQSKKGSNLTFSIIFTPKKADRITLLTLACASAIEDVLRSEYSCNDVTLKWPNDVMCQGLKLAGLLTEVVHLGNSVDRVIVGIGLNVNQEDFSETLNDVATSVKIISQQENEREKLLADILNRIEFNYHRWLSNSVDLVKEVNLKLIGYGEWITLEVDGVKAKEKTKFLGMNEKGELQVLNKDFEVDTFSYEQIRIHKN